MKHRVILCIGSNHEAEKNMQKAQEQLQKLYPGFQFSESIWTSPIGIESQDFYNCIGWCEITKDYSELQRYTKEVEKQLGDRRRLRAKGVIIIDIDILLFDGKKYHPRDWKRDYVVKLMAQLPKAYKKQQYGQSAD